jgi:hypothetical protein
LQPQAIGVEVLGPAISGSAGARIVAGDGLLSHDGGAFAAVTAAREIEIGRFSPTVDVSLNAHLNAQSAIRLERTALTFAISPAAPTDATPTRHLVTPS